MTPASVISSPADHHLRSVNSDFDAPTRKCATSDTTAAVITPDGPLSQKNGITGTIAPMNVLTPAGLEMTLAGVIVGGITYGIGLVLKVGG